MHKVLLLACCCLLAPSLAFADDKDATPTAQRKVHKIAVGGDGGWDYLTVDAAARRLYVSRGNRVVVRHDKGLELEATYNRPSLQVVDLCRERPLRWLWEDKIPLGKLTLIEGPPAVGKLFVALDLAARAARESREEKGESREGEGAADGTADSGVPLSQSGATPGAARESREEKGEGRDGEGVIDRAVESGVPLSQSGATPGAARESRE